ncbi:MAG: hypothetical protein J6Y94_06900 [Bacteriovoracaceae bacterium]|nr:hypothetical protein [Bacteriovoracaceae bacterium]
MVELWHDFWFAFLHPVKLHQFLRWQRQHLPTEDTAPVLPFKEEELNTAPAPIGPSFSTGETIALVWPLVIIKSFYTLLAIAVGFASMSRFQAVMANPFPGDWKFTQYTIVSLALFGAVLAPLVLLIYLKIWQWVLKIFGRLFERSPETSLSAPEVVNYSMASYWFLLIPILGPMLQRLAQVFYLFVGLRQNIGLSRMQSMVVACTVYLMPYLIVLFLILVLALWVYLLLGSL